MQDSVNTRDEFWERQKSIYKRAYVTIFLLALNIIMFMITMSMPGLVYGIGTLITERVIVNGEFYRIITAMFLHADIEHLMNNMVMLILAGGIVEHYVGHFYFFFLYMLSGIMGNLASMAYETGLGIDRISLGASGGTMGLAGFIVFWILINRKTFIRSRDLLVRLILLGLLMIYGCFFQAQANTVAHLGGFLTGFVLGAINIIIFKNNKNMEGLG